MLMNVVHNIYDKNEKNYSSNFCNGKELAMECKIGQQKRFSIQVEATFGKSSK